MSTIYYIASYILTDKMELHQMLVKVKDESLTTDILFCGVAHQEQVFLSFKEATMDGKDLMNR